VMRSWHASWSTFASYHGYSFTCYFSLSARKPFKWIKALKSWVIQESSLTFLVIL